MTDEQVEAISIVRELMKQMAHRSLSTTGVQVNYDGVCPCCGSDVEWYERKDDDND